MTALPRAHCRRCGRLTALRINGRVREHMRLTGNPNRSTVRCAGSGEPPGEPPDARMTAALPAALVRDPELAARVTAARAACADFRRWARGEIVAGDWQSQALRLATELESVLERIEAVS